MMNRKKMHKMPDGSMMKGASHKGMKKVKKYQAGGMSYPEPVPNRPMPTSLPPPPPPRQGTYPEPYEPTPLERGDRNDDLPGQKEVDALRARGRAMQAARQARAGQQTRRSGMPSRPSRMAGMKKGGSVKSSASRRADGCATKGKTRGRMR